MKTAIIILAALGQSHNSAVYKMQSEIKKYFGTKITEVNEDYASVTINAEVTQDDISHLKTLVNDVELLALVASEEWNNVAHPDVIKLEEL
jgi:type II secretory pathway component HofQ